jgi:hypothetical protein
MMTFVVGNNIPSNPLSTLTPQSQTQNKHFRLHTEAIIHIIGLLFLSRTDSDSGESIMISCNRRTSWIGEIEENTIQARENVLR